MMMDLALEEMDLDYATILAERAHKHLAQYDVAPTPSNFAVWFNYARGAMPELKGAIDNIIASNGSFDTNTNKKLFSDFVAATAVTMIGDVPDQLSSVLTMAKQFLAEAIADNRIQIKAIGDVAEKAESGFDPRSLVRCLIDELTKAAIRASKLEVNLSETSRELDTIRESLSRAEQQANTDTLTGLPNRRAFDEFLRRAHISAMERGEPLSLMMMDIDRFKNFNDSFGHGIGDQVLRLMASVVKQQLREGDLPARYGGEELVAVLPGAVLDSCAAIAERIRRSVSECKITRRSSGEMLPAISLSIGVAQFRPGESMTELLDRCDGALYLAKRIGRNRVVTELRLEGRSAASA